MRSFLMHFLVLILLFSGLPNGASASDWDTGASQAYSQETVALQTAFVERFYANILGRPSDEAGLKHWLSVIQHESAATVALGFLNSAEFVNQNLDDTAFVNILYLTLFDREGDSGGMAFWLAELDAGKLRNMVIWGFLRSVEFANLSDSFDVTALTVADEVDYGIQAFVERLYQLVLGRHPDEGGFDAWVSALTHRTYSGGDIARAFFLSPEYLSQSSSNEEFLITSYKALFGREADEGGLQEWLRSLSQGRSRESVLAGFIGSSEFGALTSSFGISATRLEAKITANIENFFAGNRLEFSSADSVAMDGLAGVEWALSAPHGSYSVLSGTSANVVSFEADVNLPYTLSLTVTDQQGNVAEDLLIFTPDLPEPDSLPAFSATSPPTPFVSDQTDAIRLLYQATFGPRVEDVAHLMEIGAETWFQDQVSAEPSGYVDAWASIAETFNDLDGFEGANGVRLHQETFMVNALYSADQLRHRMTYALSQLLVISADFDFSAHDQLVLGYVDVLHKNAFGNYRDLLKQIALHPAMGLFLAMLGNEKADPERNIRPDENFAREIMQLFTIGLHEMNQDGTPKLDDNNEIIQTYKPVDIQNYAAALTGWYFADLEPYRFGGSLHTVEWSLRLPPMTAYDDYHQKTHKKLLRNYYVPAGATAEESLEAVIDSLFHHPNLAPFVAKHLIKSFVTSNPSPEYVGRVAAVFNGNETGERGNLGSVIQAVLFDPEARLKAEDQPDTYGRAKDPLMRFVNHMRFFKVEGYDQQRQEHIRRRPSQEFLTAPNVFNFFSPAHVPNSDFAKLNLVAPELQIITSETLINDSGLYAYLRTLEQWEDCCIAEADEHKLYWVHYDLGHLPELIETSGTGKGIDYLDLYLTQGRLSEDSRTALFETYDDSLTHAIESGDRMWFLQTLNDLVYQVVSAPEYFIQR